jgi:hypothetical protein
MGMKKDVLQVTEEAPIEMIRSHHENRGPQNCWIDCRMGPTGEKEARQIIQHWKGLHAKRKPQG